MQLVLTQDAMTAAMTFLINQATHIEPQVNQMIYPDVQYAELIPVDTSANPWTKTVTYFSGDRFGAAKWINGNADDIPIAGNERQKHESAVFTAGIGYGFGYEELALAQMVGQNLPADDALAARRAYEEFVDDVATKGNAGKGMKGFINYPGIIAIVAPNGGWSDPATTNAEIIEDINAALLGGAAGVLFTSVADTLLMSWQRLQALGSRVLEGTSETLFSFIMRSNFYTLKTGRALMIRAVRGLETAGAGGTQRMIAYRRNPEVLKMHIPMTHRFLPVWQAGPLRWEVPGIFRLGGLDIRRPLEVRYIDGI